MSRDVGNGQVVVIDGGATPAPPVESWHVLSGGSLSLVNGAQANDLRVSNGLLNINASNATAASGDAVRIANGGSVTMDAATVVARNGVGLVITSDGNTVPGFGVAPRASISRSNISGSTFGSTLTSNGVLDVSASKVTGTGALSYGLGLFSGSATISDGSEISGVSAGIWIAASPVRTGPADQGRELIVDGSIIRGTGAAIVTDSLDGELSTSTITLRNGTQLIGGTGVAIDMGAYTKTDVVIDASDIVGDIRAGADATATLALHGGATLAGAVNGDIALGMDGNSAWSLTGDSSVSTLSLSGGSIRLGQAGDTSHRTLRVAGDYAGTGGNVQLHTVMDEGGALASQVTDRLLIEGSVTNTGTTYLTVSPSGDGALTDANKNGKVDANEGISLIQVGGASRNDAFKLAGEYVAAGPWQYKLYAFGPGETDADQKQLTGPGFNWDYRLGNSYVCERDCEPVDPGNPGVPAEPGEPGTPPPGARVEVVPQLPAYLSAPAALLTYGDMLNDGLHQRLGDIREGDSGDPIGGEVFARYLGGQLRYSSNLSFQQFGYDFDQQVNALQVGGSVIALDGDYGALRAGWALDHGTTRVTPHAVDGNSASKYTANGGATWITWLHGSGFWMDGVVAATRYRGDVSTDLRGGDVARIRANGWTMSIEAGMPFALGDEWTLEPQLELKHQQLNFRDFRDKDGLDVSLGTAKQTSARLGLQVGWSANPAFAPYGRLDLIHTTNGDPGVDVSSVDWDLGSRFKSGRVGNAMRGALGITSQLGRHVQVYGEGTWQHFTGSYGMRGWAGYAGLRVTF